MNNALKITETARPRRMLAIDILRIIAAVAVWLYHYCYLDPKFHAAPQNIHPALSAAARYGYLGVPIFFMISGLVIASSARGRNRFDFTYARAVRLYPIFLICIVPTIVALVATTQDFTVAKLAANLTMLPLFFGQGYLDGVYWSLMFEIMFYGYVALLLIGPKFVPRLRVFVSIWLLLAIVNLYSSVPLKVFLILDWAPYFCVGCSTWLIANEKKPFDRGLWLASIVAAGMASALQIRHEALFAVPIVVTAAITLPLLARMKFSPLLIRPALIAGGISYPVYLIHNQFGSWIAELTGKFWLSAIVVLSVSYAIMQIDNKLRKKCGFLQARPRT